MSSPRRLVALAATSLTLALGAAGIAANASAAIDTATVLTFDDLGGTPVGTHMVDGYGGFNWSTSDWYSMSTDPTTGNTYLALGGTATSIVSADGSDFLFGGLDAWSRRGLDATGSFYFILSRDGATVYDGRNDRDGRMRFAGTPTTFAPNYAGAVDRVAIVFTQGGGDWDHLAIDNLRVSPAPAPVATTVPPTTVAPTPAPAPAPGTVTTFKLTVKTNGKGSVAVSRTGTTFVAGQVVTLTATPAIGSGWFGWTGDVTSTARTITITMTKDMVVTANFK